MRRERPFVVDVTQSAALLAGTLTGIRRPVDRLARAGIAIALQPFDSDRSLWTFRDRAGRWSDLLRAELLSACPLGRVGEGLWVREPWAAPASLNLMKPGEFPHTPYARCITYRTDFPATEPWQDTQWRRAKHMPRWGSRIDLEIVDLGIDRISDPDPDPLSPRWEWHITWRRVRP